MNSKSSGKPLWAHANEEACSAGYALASAASKIWVARTAVVGSIGVIGTHMDRSKADEMAGQKWTFITAGQQKADGNPHEPLSTGALARFQADIDDLMTMFVDLVSKHRGIGAEKVRATEAGIYRGKAAVRAGLADKVGKLEDALAAMSNEVSGRLVAPARFGNTTSLPASLEVRANAATARHKHNDAAVVAVRDPAIEIEAFRRRQLTELAAQAGRLGGEFDAQRAIAGGITILQARQEVMNALADKQSETEIFGKSSNNFVELRGSQKKASQAWAKAYENIRK